MVIYNLQVGKFEFMNTIVAIKAKTKDCKIFYTIRPVTILFRWPIITTNDSKNGKFNLISNVDGKNTTESVKYPLKFKCLSRYCWRVNLCLLIVLNKQKRDRILNFLKHTETSVWPTSFNV